MKKAIISILLVASFITLILFETSKPATASINPNNCYQTMGYCGGSINYKCTSSYTAEKCRLYACESCD